ncbi:hypothetical protein SmJEL517_g04330 [Synchytrium microbalum]|uniref:non-specific serine/threonine protein kinase n=1 Tax=Synchytrium microbalum TaxID=1806994 RepID=A0A507BUH6_9FUNG|nr:uncharacterized protein SmJEL517_g04330 [Synchytrium microbalum]TPX32597.1 hypothetical protein SmJEL517_g04330 [Synchytrium microbalum]
MDANQEDAQALDVVIRISVASTNSLQRTSPSNTQSEESPKSVGSALASQQPISENHGEEKDASTVIAGHNGTKSMTQLPPPSQPQRSESREILSEFTQLGIHNRFPKYIPGQSGPYMSHVNSACTSPLTSATNISADHEHALPDLSLGPAAMSKRPIVGSNSSVRSVSQNGISASAGAIGASTGDMQVQDIVDDEHRNYTSLDSTSKSHTPLMSGSLHPMDTITEATSIENIHNIGKPEHSASPLGIPPVSPVIRPISRNKSNSSTHLFEKGAETTMVASTPQQATSDEQLHTTSLASRTRDDTLTRKRNFLHRLFHRESVTSQDGVETTPTHSSPGISSAEPLDGTSTPDDEAPSTGGGGPRDSHEFRRGRSSVNGIALSDTHRPKSIVSKIFGLYYHASSPDDDINAVDGGHERTQSMGSQENLSTTKDKENPCRDGTTSPDIPGSPKHTGSSFISSYASTTEHSESAGHALAFSFFRRHHPSITASGATDHHGNHMHDDTTKECTEHHTNNLLREILIHRRSKHHSATPVGTTPTSHNAVAPNNSATNLAFSSSPHPITPVTDSSSASASPSVDDGSPMTMSSTPKSRFSMHRTASEQSMTEKYGRVDEVLGRGANAVVKLAHKVSEPVLGCSHEKLYAVKEFRKQRKCESYKEYIKKLVAEFCISSSMHNENVVETVDLIQDERDRWCEVMEYLGGGDLFSYIAKGLLKDVDAINCYFKQVVQGVAYIHSMGVAHRDLKPENLLLDISYGTLKITDFGVSEVYRTAFEKAPRKAKGLCGSEPYIAPEEWEEGAEYDPCKVDVWAIGIIYYTMIYNSVPWRASKQGDTHYQCYLSRRHPGPPAHGFIPFDRQPPGTRDMLYRLLDPSADQRISITEIMNDPWFMKIESCKLATKDTHVVGHHHESPAPK